MLPRYAFLRYISAHTTKVQFRRVGITNEFEGTIDGTLKKYR